MYLQDFISLAGLRARSVLGRVSKQLQVLQATSQMRPNDCTERQLFQLLSAAVNTTAASSLLAPIDAPNGISEIMGPAVVRL